MKLEIALALTAFLTNLHGANLFSNPGFETLPSDHFYEILASGDDADLPGWSVTGACADNCVLLLTSDYTEPSGANTLRFPPHSGSQSLDLTGSYNSLLGGIEQTVAVTPGNYYLVSFWVGNMDDRVGDPYTLPSSIEVFVNGVSQGVFSNDQNAEDQTDWQQASFIFVASASNAIIRFQNATTGDDLAGLDDVSLESVPERSTFGLAAFALGLLGLGRCRFRNATRVVAVLPLRQRNDSHA